MKKRKKRKLTPRQRKVAADNLVKARRAKAIKQAEERIVNGAQRPSGSFMSVEAIAERDRLSERGDYFVTVVTEFEAILEEYVTRGGGDPEEVEAKEREYRYARETLLSFRHIL